MGGVLSIGCGMHVCYLARVYSLFKTRPRVHYLCIFANKHVFKRRGRPKQGVGKYKESFFSGASMGAERWRRTHLSLLVSFERSHIVQDGRGDP